MKAEKKVKDTINKLLSIKGQKSVDDIHMALGHIMWDKCGMSRNAKGLRQAISDIRALKKEFWQNVYVPGTAEEFNPELEKAGRVADFLELGELMVIDALNIAESCGGHFRVESRTPEGEAARNDDEYSYVAAWEFAGDNADPILNKEELVFNDIELKTRSYK